MASAARKCISCRLNGQEIRSRRNVSMRMRIHGWGCMLLVVFNCVCMCSPSVLRCVVHAVHRLDFLCYFVQFSSFPVTSHRFSQVHMAQPLDVTVVLGNLAASQEKLQSEIRSMKDQLLAGQEDTAQRVAHKEGEILRIQ